MNVLPLLLFFISAKTDPLKPIQDVLRQNNTLANTRRILGGREITDTRPYMVYLRPAVTAETRTSEQSNWLCGGMIIHERYILTSAACIEDVKQFYVVSGTHRWIPPTEHGDDCIIHGAKKAVWKCVPKTYNFDGNDFDNIRWMVKDIAVVKVEDDFNFKKRVRGCDFIPKMVAYNNITDELEKPKTVASIAGWGSTERFSDVIATETVNSPILQETDVVLISKKNCRSRWAEQYHHIIDENMICAKDNMDADAMSSLCSEQEVNCKEMVYSDENEDDQARRFVPDPQFLQVHNASHGPINDSRRMQVVTGGFCENDHGGPLIVGRGTSAVVVGVISACQTMDVSHKCHGPYLYTSVWKNRHMINCAIAKEMGDTCKRLLRSTKTQIVETLFDWNRHPEPVRSAKTTIDPKTTKKVLQKTSKKKAG